MPIKDGIIVAPVSIEDIRKALGSNSTDVATLCEDSHINVWAKFKPIPCKTNLSNNIPARLSANQIKEENYGTELEFDPHTSAGDRQTFDSWAREMYKGNTTGVKKTEWNPLNASEKQFHRITDFCVPEDYIRSDGSNTPLGYDHYASPVTDTSFTIKPLFVAGGQTYTFNPLVPLNYRKMIIGANSDDFKFAFPPDYMWLDSYVSGEASVTGRNENWLYPIDFIMSSSGNLIIGSETRRGLCIYKINTSDNLEPVGLLLEPVRGSGNSSGTPTDTVFCDTVDFTNDSTIKTSYGYNLGEMSGKFFFVEFWNLQYKNGLSGNYPILGFSYTVEIERYSGTVMTDINDKTVNPWKFVLYDYSNTGGLLELTAYRYDLSTNYDFSNVFSSLKLVISQDNKGFYGIKRSWNILAKECDDGPVENENAAGNYIQMGFDIFDELGNELNPEYDGMYAVLIGVFKDVPSGEYDTGTTSIELHSKNL